MIWSRLTRRFEVRSAALLVTLETRLDSILMVWLLLSGLGVMARLLTSPPVMGVALPNLLLPYGLLVLAPAASMLLARRWFTETDRQPRPELPLFSVGNWRSVSLERARREPLYGTGGIMVSLLIGILLNIPVRAAEYLAAVPALGGPVPDWLFVLRSLLSLDVVLLPSLYAIVFVAALRRSPLFPRLLAGVWVADIGMQVLTAQLVGRTNDLPAAVAQSLYGLLDGNVTKVLISVAVWTPYLLLSRRVNITFRHRLPA
ncbi:DUF2569 domain-containing protein [Sphingomonas sp. KRR8]|uniref:DUF2569 domain-containing protein n=1 Tax=Sphingomonas sp. KRR8 TaxID=2942996 RepID=UPI00201FE444|nr:DUF2569 domain-containing protein [Sphingomonas sp. KRR8]URD60871.1 DUF2569 domain-containing protein [Sphingomonas sp. KRR8]